MKAIDDDLQTSLSTLERKGVRGATACKANKLPLKECARVLTTMYPARASPALDGLVREAHQAGLRRRGDMELLLRVLGPSEAGLAARAKKQYLSTPRGAVIDELRRRPPWVAYGAVGVTLALAILCTALWLRIELGAAGAMKVTESLDSFGSQDAMRKVAKVALMYLYHPYIYIYPASWFALKKMVVVAALAILWSGRRLLSVAMREKKTPPRALLAAASAIVLASGALSLYMRTPLLFVVGCAAASWLANRARAV
jgi:hypothetical protein